jgi:hypothetical protein
MLTNRETRLRFNDHTSNPIIINNGIGQGDPLSMELYQYYNANLLNIPADPNQLAITYVDDAILFASGSTFKETVMPLGLSLVPCTNLYLYSATMCTTRPLLLDLPSYLRLYGLCHYLNT